ncbi:MAG TPA: tetratricopeptide repeat protein [Geminicoccaceae bacterium]|nr:tetratricopeptide repeat protein [Geminicoccaceae bacterium]
MRNAIQNLAKTSVTVLLKSDPSALAVEAGKLAIDKLFGWLPQKGKLETLIARVEGELKRLAELEFGGRADLEPAIGNVTILFERFGLTATELVDLSLKPERASEELLTRGKPVLDAAGEAVAGLCRGRIVPQVYELLLSDPQTIAELSSAIASALLSQREAIGKIPDEVGLALRRMLGRHLVIDPTEVWQPGTSDIYLLRAEYGVVPFHEQRRPEVDRLLAWCGADPRMAVRVMLGAGGTGKTRLMIELCRQARGRHWRAGFLHRETPVTPSWDLDGLVDGQDPLLLVVDYAETKRDVLVPVLRRLSLNHRSAKTRVILVARAVSDWLLDLRRADPKLQELLDETRVLVEELSPIALPLDQRAQILEAAAAEFADRLVMTDIRRRRLTPGELSAPHFANVLFLHIAALAAVVGDPAREEDALLRFVLIREERYWQAGLSSANLGQDLDVSSVAQAVALTTLAGGVNHKAEARMLLAHVPSHFALTPTKRDRLIDLLRRLYPGERYLEPLRPDLLGEELVGKALSDDPALLTAALGGGASQDQVQNALTVLTRLAQRRPDAERWLEQAFAGDLERLAEPAIRVAIETGPPMGKVLAQALTLQPLKEPARLEPMIPGKTAELIEVGVVVLTQQWSRLLATPKPWADDVKAKAAPIAMRLANRLSAAGQPHEALALAQEATDIYDALAAQAPDVYRPDLATALNNLGNHLSYLDRTWEALVPARKAVAIFRELVRKKPHVYEPNLAMALNNLSGCWSAVDQRQQALKAAWDATGIFRKLAEAAPDAFRFYFAGALGNLANRYSEVGQHQKALAAAQEVADLFRNLTEEAPDAYRPDLVRALNNLAASLIEFDRYEQALEVSLKAIRTLKPLFLSSPLAFSDLMALAVENYSAICEGLGGEADAELVGPILDMLQRTRNGLGGKQAADGEPCF